MHDNLRVQVKEAMVAQKITTRELAARVGVVQTTVLDFLHGRRKTSLLISRAFCRELGLDYDETNREEAKVTA